MTFLNDLILLAIITDLPALLAAKKGHGYIHDLQQKVLACFIIIHATTLVVKEEEIFVVPLENLSHHVWYKKRVLTNEVLTVYQLPKRND